MLINNNNNNNRISIAPYGRNFRGAIHGWKKTLNLLISDRNWD